jgi:GT2 family glycosyltransferase
MSRPVVCCVVLNTNRREDTLACLRSIRDGDYPRTRALVLDNASTDGSVEAIRAGFPEVQVVELAENLGYAGNNNVGIREAMRLGADWVLILNEDAVLAPDAISRLVEVGGGDASCGFVGPVVYHSNEPQRIQSAGGFLDRSWRSGHRAQNQFDRGQFTVPHESEWVSGCAIMVRREVVEQTGMLDERFYYYWEETEWCLRARRAGWRIWIAPQAKAWHKGVQSDYRPGPDVTYYWARNWLLMLSKHRAPARAWLAAMILLGRSLLSWTFRPRWRLQKAHRDALWQGVSDFFRRRWGPRRFLGSPPIRQEGIPGASPAQAADTPGQALTQ